MQEEADLQLRHPLVQHLRHEHELVIVHPDEVARFRHLEHLVGEALVDVAVVIPPRGVVAHVVRHVMQQRPDARVREAFVMTRDFFFAEEDRDAAVLARRGRRSTSCCRAGSVDRAAGPADPLQVVLFRRQPFERRDESAGRFRDRLADRDRQAIGDIDDGRGHEARAEINR